MQDPIVLLLTVTVVILTIVIVAFLIVLILVLLMMRRSLKKIDIAVANVENTALRTMMPLLGIRSMFADVESFVSSAKAWVNILTGKKTKPKKISEVPKE